MREGTARFRGVLEANGGRCPPPNAPGEGGCAPLDAPLYFRTCTATVYPVSFEGGIAHRRVLGGVLEDAVTRRREGGKRLISRQGGEMGGRSPPRGGLRPPSTPPLYFRTRTATVYPGFIHRRSRTRVFGCDSFRTQVHVQGFRPRYHSSSNAQMTGSG